MKHYAIKGPGGSWILESVSRIKRDAWIYAEQTDKKLSRAVCDVKTKDMAKVAQSLGYTCVEVSGFVEVK